MSPRHPPISPSVCVLTSSTSPACGLDGPASVDPILSGWVETHHVWTRPRCPYPQTAIYEGSGSTDDANNYRCGGNLETRPVVCADVLTRYKHEVNGPLDFRDTGVSRLRCFREQRGHGVNK
jgi:hypothetical protein